MHLATKYLIFGFLKGPIHDPWLQRGRSRFIAAVDLCFNSRMVGLGMIDQRSGRNKSIGKDGDVAEPSKPSGQYPLPYDKEHWLPYTHSSRSWLASVWWHIWRSALSYTAIDFTLSLMWQFGAAQLCDPRGRENSIKAFLDASTFVLFPRSSSPIPIPRVVVEVGVELGVACGVWQAISWLYHLAAALLVGSGLWESQSWELDIFDKPWKADSILDMWGRRWHQLFRVSSLFLAMCRSIGSKT